MTAPCTDPRTLRDGDVVEHRAVVRAGAVVCLDCGRKWAAKVEKSDAVS
jgi:hypothetical protein